MDKDLISNTKHKDYSYVYVMVKYGIEYWTNHMFPNNKKPPVHFVVYTNEITNKILEEIDINCNPNIIFQIPLNSSNRIIDFNVDLHNWHCFSLNIENLRFNGVLVENQFTSNHLKYMKKLKNLYIGGTTYPLFEGEDVSELPIIKIFERGGYGVVKKSESLDKWIRLIDLNNIANNIANNIT
jgi:hypothetical protein